MEAIYLACTKYNGCAVDVEKNKRISPNDMEAITMWADASSRGADARDSASPAIDVQNVISSFDATKIRRNAELAISKNVKNTNSLKRTKVCGSCNLQCF